MSDILYERPLAGGPSVRIRRTSPEGETPVRAVLEVDRRGGQLRPGQTPGNPPPILEAEGESDSDVFNKLLPHAMEDQAVARLMQTRGLR
ncbi:MAG TPA: hypothetical protein VJR92_09505 [Gemmatimonadaceae bacterium]|nr:hypothetical protein [Gemmatimonadaceae bacterium]